MGDEGFGLEMEIGDRGVRLASMKVREQSDLMQTSQGGRRRLGNQDLEF